MNSKSTNNLCPNLHSHPGRIISHTEMPQAPFICASTGIVGYAKEFFEVHFSLQVGIIA